MTRTIASIDRAAVIAQYERNRARTRALFALLSEDAYYTRPIASRHPIVFYEGHLPAFSFNVLVKKALRESSIDSRLEALFARGIDPPETPKNPSAAAEDEWPERRIVQQFVQEADRRVLDALRRADLDVPGDPLLDGAEAVHTILEHEAMHQETLMYMWHRLPFEQKRRPPDYRPTPAGVSPIPEWIDIPDGDATLGVHRGSIPFGWDNEFPFFSVTVPAFQIERFDVTNASFRDFVDAGGYRDARWWRPDDWDWIRSAGIQHPSFWERRDGEWYWRGMFDLIPLPPAWPVYVSQAEPHAYARWRRARLPTEAEFQRAADGAGAGGAYDFGSWDPEPAGTHPESRSASGVDDLIGNGWEWTSTVFAPFPGFRPMSSYPEYSADFFDGEHFVIKGASPATARELIRPSFRNWFRPRYPFVYATFRCARSAG